MTVLAICYCVTKYPQTYKLKIINIYYLIQFLNVKNPTAGYLSRHQPGPQSSEDMTEARKSKTAY